MNQKQQLLEVVRWAESPTLLHEEDLKRGYIRVEFFHQNSWNHYPHPVGKLFVWIREKVTKTGRRHLEVQCPCCLQFYSSLQIGRHAIIHFPKLPKWEWKVNEWVDEEGVHHCEEYYYVYTGGLERPERIRADRWFWSTGVDRLCPTDGVRGTNLPPGR